MSQSDSNAHAHSNFPGDSESYSPDMLSASSADEADRLADAAFISGVTPAVAPPLVLHKDAPLLRPGH